MKWCCYCGDVGTSWNSHLEWAEENCNFSQFERLSASLTNDISVMGTKWRNISDFSKIQIIKKHPVLFISWLDSFSWNEDYDICLKTMIQMLNILGHVSQKFSTFATSLLILSRFDFIHTDIIFMILKLMKWWKHSLLWRQVYEDNPLLLTVHSLILFRM